MLSKKSSILIAAIGTLFCFFSVAYISCSKPGSAPKCNGVTCENGGSCYKGNCVCPVGYEGGNCGTASVAKYIGAWDVHTRITASDSLKYVGIDSNYIVFFKNTATPTTFFIDNFLGNPKYNNIISVLDSTNSFRFKMDTLRNQNMWFDRTVLTYGNGSISADGKTVSGQMMIKHLNGTLNWQNDTLSFSMTPHHF
jgi:hypothetical protein